MEISENTDISQFENPRNLKGLECMMNFHNYVFLSYGFVEPDKRGVMIGFLEKEIRQ